MSQPNEPRIGLKLEGQTLRFFEKLVSQGLAKVHLDSQVGEQPYATIQKSSEGTQIVVHAQSFFAAEDSLVTAHQAFFAAEDGTPL